MSRFDLATVTHRLRTRAASADPTDGARAAVATLLREGVDGAEILFIKRAERDGDPWSGHVAFPGGKREPGEALLATAVRETEEEVGLVLPPAALVTRLGDVRARSSGYRVAQFVFALDNPAAPIAANAEVAATLWVPLERLARLDGAGTITFAYGGVETELPSIRLGEYVLWGMTYRMTMQLLEAVDDEGAVAGGSAEARRAR